MGENEVFEQVTRQMVISLQDELDEFKRRINGSLDKIDNRLCAIEKELNSRPSWAVSVVVTVLSSLCTGLGVYLLTH